MSDQAPYIMVTMDPEKGEVVVTNIKKSAAPAMLWLLEKARIAVMAGTVGQDESKVVAPGPGGMNGLRHRMGLG